MKKSSVVFITVISITCLLSSVVYATDPVDELTNKINEYTVKLEELGKSKNTLANQIETLDSHMSLTLLKISQTEKLIATTESEISSLSAKINELDISLNQLSSVFVTQVSENYKLQKRIPALNMFSSGNFNKFLEQYKYFSIVQKQSIETLFNLENIRTNYDIQKEQKKQKQLDLEKLKVTLSTQQDSLKQQKKSKSNLLEVTKNNENKYQQLKKIAEDELNSLLKAKFVGKRAVKAGEALGLMGNTGYSFGDHLHFGLYDLKESDLNYWSYQNDIDSSNYITHHMWPLNDPITITQGRGQTKYSYMYSDHFHHGIDLVSTNLTVRSIADGIAYFYRNPDSSLGNHVKLFHKDGKMTLYLHLQ